MKSSQFLFELPKLLLSSQGDMPFATLKILTDGMTSARIAKVLNYATRCLAENEFYCEIGTFSGYTMISAGHDNCMRIVGIDNFTYGKEIGVVGDESSKMNDNIKKRLFENIARFGHTLMQFLEQDFRNVAFDEKQKMGVLFIDGYHVYKDVIDSFEWSRKFLSDEAMILVDDVNVAEVAQAVADWTQNNQDYKLMFHLNPTCGKELGRFNDSVLHNGLSVIYYARTK